MKTDRFPSNLTSLVKSRPRETMLVVAAAAILLLLTGFSYWLTQRVLHDAERADALNLFNAKLTELVQMLRTTESSQRGYLIAGSPDFLQPYNEYNGKLLPLVVSLEASTPSESSRQAIAGLIAPLKAKLQEMQETIDLVNRGQKNRAIELLQNGVGRRLTGQIESRVKAIQASGNDLIHADDDTTRFLQRLNVVIDAIGVLLILTFSFLSLWLLLRSNAATEEAQNELAKVNSELEDIVTQRTAALTRANQEIQRFAYIVSHDLRSPLVNIMGFTSELEALRSDLFESRGKAGIAPDPEILKKDFDEALEFIKSSIARMDRLIGAILRISREGSRPLNPERIDMNALFQGLLSAVAHQVREKAVTVETGELPPIVSDKLALEQIFSNLIENAIKFLKQGEGGRIGVDGQIRGNEIVYTVSDNGRGIEPKDHQRIFELFRRAGPQDVPGEGMGLAYVTALVRRLGGTVTVESALGGGSSFKVTLPKAIARPERRAA